MKLRIFLAVLCSVVIAAVAAPAAAQAGPTDNNAAAVSGVASVPLGRFCQDGYFCLWTNSYWSGREFQLYRCGTYALSQWNGVGSWLNKQTGGAHAKILDRDRKVLVDSVPNQSNYSYNFRTAWYIKLC